MSIELALKLIARKVQDSSYSDEDYIDLMNVCVGEIATEPGLPALIKSADVVVPEGEYQVAVPDDYFAHPIFPYLKVYNLTSGIKSEVTTWKYLSEFLERFGDLEADGDVSHACVSGQTMYVQYRPRADQTLRLWYTQMPPVIEDADSDISFIPKQLQVPLLVNYVCYQVYSEIEDGVEGRAPNMDRYFAKYQMALKQLSDFVVRDGTPDFVPLSGETDEWGNV